MLKEVANYIVNTSLLVSRYSTIANIPNIVLGLPHTLDRLNHIDCYIYDIITVVQGGIEQQLQVFDGTL